MADFGAVTSCSGVVIGNNVYTHCKGNNPNNGCQFNGLYSGAVSAGPPMTLSVDFSNSMGACGSAVSETGHIAETKAP